eukprot:354174-Chlamydomonas_euryale.AAC.5
MDLCVYFVWWERQAQVYEEGKARWGGVVCMCTRVYIFCMWRAGSARRSVWRLCRPPAAAPAAAPACCPCMLPLRAAAACCPCMLPLRAARAYCPCVLPLRAAPVGCACGHCSFSSAWVPCAKKR